MNYLILPLIAVTGILTVYTDIKRKKITNRHLLFILTITAALYLYLFLTKRLLLSWGFLVNIALSLAISLILYYFKLWRGGDGKLFIIYALLVPVNSSPSLFPYPCLVLFSNTFIISFIFIVLTLPFLIISNTKTLFKDIISSKTLKLLIATAICSYSVSSLFSLILGRFLKMHNIYLLFIIMFFGVMTLRKYIKEYMLGPLFFLILVINFLLAPENMLGLNILFSFKNTLIYSLIFYVFYDIITVYKEELNKRVPFAHFMLIGAVLSYTGFLNYFTGRLTSIWR